MSINDAERLAQQLLDDETTDLTSAVNWIGAGPDVDLDALDALAMEIHSDLAEQERSGGPLKGDEYEGARAVDLYRALEHLPLVVLDDPGFWRYVGLVRLWHLVTWRESKAFESRDWSKYSVYVDGRRSAECVPLRMFIRGRIAVAAGDEGLASAVPDATDLWRSHIVRVRTGYSPTLASGLLRAQRDDRLPTNQLREYAKRINRVASNVVLHVYDDESVDSLLGELRDA